MSYIYMYIDSNCNQFVQEEQALLEGNSPTPEKWTNLRAKFEEIRNKSEAFLAQGRGEDGSKADTEEETKSQEYNVKQIFFKNIFFFSNFTEWFVLTIATK